MSAVGHGHAELAAAFAALRRFTRPAPAAAARCELCGAVLAERHAHLFEPEPRALSCACSACALLFPAGARAQRLRIEPRVQPLPELQLSDQDWAVLDVPVRLVFLCPSAHHQQLFALYPSPQGAVEARLPFAAWRALTATHPQLNQVAPELDALLLDGRAGRTTTTWVSIDVCHALLGTLRGHGPNAAPSWREFERALQRVQRGEHA